MTAITREVWIDAPKQTVWKQIENFGGIVTWNPGVTDSYLTSDQAHGVGATRHCDLGGGSSVEERVLEWREGEFVEIEIYDGAKIPPFKRATATIQLREENGGTRAAGTIEYTLKMGPLGALMDSTMVKRNFEKAWTALFAGLNYYVETGEKIGKPTEVELAPVQAIAT